MTIYDNPKHRDFWDEVMKKHSPKLKTTPKPRKHDEKDLQDSICQYLKVKNIFHWRQNVGAIKMGDRFVSFGRKGMADVVAIHNQRAYFIEVKSLIGKQSEAQKHFQEEVENAGAIYILAKSIDDVIERI